MSSHSVDLDTAQRRSVKVSAVVVDAGGNLVACAKAAVAAWG